MKFTPGLAFNTIDGSTVESQHPISKIFGVYYYDNS